MRTRAYRFSGNTPAFPARWFYGLYRALPGDRLVCHRRPAGLTAELDASIGASEPHDFAVRLTHRSSRAHQRPPHPAPRFVTIASAPLVGTGWGKLIALICPTTEGENFSREGWTGFLICPSGWFLARRTQLSPSFRGVRSTNYDVQLHIGESITTIVSMDSGPAPSGASRNDDGGCGARFRARRCAAPRNDEGG